MIGSLRFKKDVNVALGFLRLILKLCPIQVVISLSLWIKLTMGQFLLLFMCNFFSFFSYSRSVLVTNLLSLQLVDIFWLFSYFANRLFHLIWAVACAHATTCATSLMHAKSSTPLFCLWHLLFGLLEWRKWKSKNIKLNRWTFFHNIC